ncbi:TniQ family protein [Lysobacter soli]|uniref:TniQ family protein n=1 Tax=Lysobacter soli TaxID=453783 RepID=UPI003CF83F61
MIGGSYSSAEFASLRDPEPTESLSSYLAAWRGHAGVSHRRFMDYVAKSDPAAAVALLDDPDYPKHPCWRDAVAKLTGIDQSVLTELATSLGPWPLLPPCRVHACVGCLDDYGSPSGHARSKMWSYATWTICPIHNLPLMQVPAVGWEWMEIAPAQRKANARLMLRPDLVRASVEAAWSRLEQPVRNAIFHAESCAWLSPSGPSPYRDALKYNRFEDRYVWEDLLSFLCRSWERGPAPSLACLVCP